MQIQLNSDYWEERYQEGRTGWDLGVPAPAFVGLLNLGQAPRPGRIAVLGSGRGHDALLFAEKGFDVVGFDFAPSAIAAATQAAQQRNLTAQFFQRNIFELVPEFAHCFDYVLEHTCFCAIAPEQRSEYVKLVHALLRPDGELIALFWAHNMSGGPPFGVTVDELQELFMPYFEFLSFEQADNSVANRSDEYLARLRKIMRKNV